MSLIDDFDGDAYMELYDEIRNKTTKTVAYLYTALTTEAFIEHIIDLVTVHSVDSSVLTEENRVLTAINDVLQKSLARQLSSEDFNQEVENDVDHNDLKLTTDENGMQVDIDDETGNDWYIGGYGE